MTSDNVITLDLSRFTDTDIAAVKSLGEKQRLLYRWFRSERKTEVGLDVYMIYSGTRSQTPYAAYRIERHREGVYHLFNQRTDEKIKTGRRIMEIIDSIPDDFYYSL
ncbi:MAG: hypothetical protein VW226_04500 [Rhodospirillaceae bacterium]